MKNNAKRIKSFFIGLGSFALTAFGTIIFTPQWADFIAWANATFQSTLLGYGIPTVVTIVIALFIAEVWKQILNAYIAKKAGYSSSRVAGARRELDLY